MVTVRNYRHSKELAREMHDVYEKAFPPDEKAPFRVVMEKAAEKKADFLVAYEDGEFAGFAYTVKCGNVVYLFYLAVKEEKRGRGIGSMIVDAVKIRYSGKKIFLGREQLDESAENYSMRVRRRNFYIRCGFSDIPCVIKEAGVPYDVMSIGGEIITAEEYDRLITSWGGIVRKIVFNMHLVRK